MAHLGQGLAHQPRGQGLDLLPPGMDKQGLEAGVDQLVHVLRLEVLLGLVLIYDEVPGAVVPVDGPLVVAENGKV